MSILKRAPKLLYRPVRIGAIELENPKDSTSRPSLTRYYLLGPQTAWTQRQLAYLPTVWLWTSHLTSLYFSQLICTTSVIITLTS